MLRLAGDKAGPKFGEHAEVEPGISQFEPQGVLPVDPGPDSVSGLSIAEVLEELEDRDQSQPPRRKGGLPPARIEPSEVLILVEDAKFIPEPGHNVALRESCPGNPHGLGRDLTNRLGMKAHGFLLLLNSQQGIRRQYLRNIGAPLLVRALSREVLLEQVGRDRKGVMAVRGALEAPLLPGLEAVLAHQPSRSAA